jgi:hypothetical protein
MKDLVISLNLVSYIFNMEDHWGLLFNKPQDAKNYAENISLYNYVPISCSCLKKVGDNNYSSEITYYFKGVETFHEYTKKDNLGEYKNTFTSNIKITDNHKKPETKGMDLRSRCIIKGKTYVWICGFTLKKDAESLKETMYSLFPYQEGTICIKNEGSLWVNYQDALYMGAPFYFWS